MTLTESLLLAEQDFFHLPLQQSIFCMTTLQTKRVRILNTLIDNISISDLLKDLDSGVVFTPNVDHLIKLQKDPEFRDVYTIADYKICDSQILMYAAKFLGTPIKEKISGSDFFPAFYNYHKNNRQIKIFLLGAQPGVARKAQVQINAKVGRNIVTDVYSPPLNFENDAVEQEEIIRRINSSGATVLAVGLGAPKQESWISKYKHKLPKIKIFLAIGATIDFEAGHKKRSPKLVSKLGLEWLHRLISEPKRLWKRYLCDDLPFVWLIFQEKMSILAIKDLKVGEEISLPKPDIKLSVNQ